MARVLALVDDLFFQAKISEAARQLGVELKSCLTAKALFAEMEKEMPKLVLVDLNARQGALEAIEQVRGRDRELPLVAFLSHVQVELAQQAARAGCDTVMPRSKFAQNLAAILARAKS